MQPKEKYRSVCYILCSQNRNSVALAIIQRKETYRSIDNGCVHLGLQLSNVQCLFTYCAIIVNQSYTKDFLNSAFKARHSNFQMLDKVNDDLYKRCLLLYFMLKNKNLTNHSKKTKSTGFARTF